MKFIDLIITIKPSIFSALLKGIVLVVTLLSGCSDINTNTNSLTFTPKYNNKLLKCFSSFIHQDKKWQYSQLQFFISEVAVKDNNGQWQVWPLSDNQYQSNNIALLGEYCQASPVKQQADHQLTQGNWQLSFKQAIDLSTFTQLRFTLGVPFSFNHQNPLLQTSPLNVPQMFWVWQSGHKFFRLDIEEQIEAANGIDPKDHWQFHLGSTGCKAPSPLRPPNKTCTNANQTKIIMDMDSKSTKPQRIAVDLAALFLGLSITKKNSCQSEPDNDNCLVLFEHLGLIASKAQSTFKWHDKTSPDSLSK